MDVVKAIKQVLINYSNPFTKKSKEFESARA